MTFLTQSRPLARAVIGNIRRGAIESSRLSLVARSKSSRHLTTGFLAPAIAKSYVSPGFFQGSKQQANSFATATAEQAMGLAELQKGGVVKDVIDNIPRGALDAKYGSHAVKFGNVLTPTQVKDPPQVSWEADPNKFYTLIMTDPDAPSRANPKNREWHHWIVVNIPGNNVAQGETLSEYIGAGPPQGTGLHRYVLLVYEQPGKLTFDEPRLTNRSGEHRGKWSARKFAAKHKLGEPIAANFFQAEWDSYVPKLYEQLSGK